MLKASVRNYIIQVAVDKVVEGIDPEDLETEEEIECFNNTVKEMQDFIDQYGIEKFHQTSWDVGDYD